VILSLSARLAGAQGAARPKSRRNPAPQANPRPIFKLSRPESSISGLDGPKTSALSQLQSKGGTLGPLPASGLRGEPAPCSAPKSFQAGGGARPDSKFFQAGRYSKISRGTKRRLFLEILHNKTPGKSGFLLNRRRRIRWYPYLVEIPSRSPYMGFDWLGSTPLLLIGKTIGGFWYPLVFIGKTTLGFSYLLNDGFYIVRTSIKATGEL